MVREIWKGIMQRVSVNSLFLPRKFPTTTMNMTEAISRLAARIKERKLRLRRRIELARLHRIRKKNVPQYTYCKNCGTRLEGMYCHHCGQYALDTEQPFWKYVRQYFENVYQFDTKVWRTLWYMFTRPGFLTAEFNAGKINSYVHPFRLYMCISVVFFAVVFMLTGDRVGDLNSMNTGHLKRRIVQQLEQPAALADTTVYLYQAPDLVKVLSMHYGIADVDSLVRYQLVDTPYGLARTTLPRLLVDSCFRVVNIDGQDWDFIRQTRAMEHLNIENWIDGKDYGPDNVEAIHAFPVDSLHVATTDGRDSLVLDPARVYVWNDTKNAEVATLQREQFTNDFLNGLSKWTPFYMMFLLPLFAFMLKVLYYRKHMPYMWHFVHAIHLNTVFLILLSIPLIPLFAYGIDDILSDGTTLTYVQRKFAATTIAGFPIAMFLYMFVSFHVVYRQGWIKTLVKSVLFFATFTAIALLVATLLLLWLVVTIDAR